MLNLCALSSILLDRLKSVTILVVACADTVTGCTNITRAKACARDMLIVVLLFSMPDNDKLTCTVTFLMYSFIILYDDACRNLSNAEVRCTINPYTGFEITQNSCKKYSGEIAIIGSGIKGLEAALYAASMGIKPIVYEKSDFGGQFNEIIDQYKKRDFMPLLEYYHSMLKRYGIEIRYESSNNGILCLPDKVYPDIGRNGDLSIDTNIYRYFDDVLKIAEKNRVIMSTRSLHSLERSRIDGYMKIAEKMGIEFKDMDSYVFQGFHEPFSYINHFKGIAYWRYVVYKYAILVVIK